jgi:tetratricopeptide (TPR) repeat protein
MDSWAEHGLKLFDKETHTFGLNLDRATALWRERDHQVAPSAVDVKPRPPSDGTLAFLALLAPQLQAKSKKNLHADSVRDAHDAAKEWLELSRASGADCSLPLANYGDVLRDSYVLQESNDDLLMAIKLYEEALEGDRNLVLDHDSLLSELSTALYTLCLNGPGNHPDILGKRIEVLQQLLVLRKDDASKRRPVLQDLGWIYMTLSDILQTREPSLLKAREMYEEALAIQPRDPVSDADITSNIGIVLDRLGHQRGDIQLLLEAETMHRRVLLVHEQEETEDDQAVCNGFCPYCKTVNRVNNLGTALVHLHDIGGDERKLDEAIELFEAGIQEDLERHHKVTRNSIAMQSNYAGALHNRYLTQNDVASLDEALRCGSPLHAPVTCVF